MNHPEDPPSSSSSSEYAAAELAATWLAQRDIGFSPVQAAEFVRWRDADPRHAAAFRRAEAAHQILARLPEVPGAAALFAEVDALTSPRPAIVTRSVFWKTTLGLAAAACLGFVLLPARRSFDAANATYSTTAGQHQTIGLPDGSTLVLNSSSNVDVAFEAKERRVRLQHGEAHFYVAKDASRPFLVTAGTVTVRAVGTAFNVRRQVAAVEVLVTEGKVKVSRKDTPDATAEAEPIYLVAGERAFIDSVPVNAIVAGQSALSVPTAEAATQRAPRLMFSNTPLSDVVERFNHYSRLQMEIVDSDLGRRSVGGNFDADNAESFITLLNVAGDVRVERVSESRVLLHKVQ